jgi:hypothetical protein
MTAMTTQIGVVIVAITPLGLLHGSNFISMAFMSSAKSQSKTEETAAVIEPMASKLAYAHNPEVDDANYAILFKTRKMARCCTRIAQQAWKETLYDFTTILAP